jgi:hypothetical protein
LSTADGASTVVDGGYEVAVVDGGYEVAVSKFGRKLDNSNEGSSGFV